ncbi:hypothetical protein EDD11_007985 [Mortierella claussenii]|nr:hypothetical protein EDD11_007985 [Mortierella claussenii]
MVLIPKQQDLVVIIKEHQDSGCTLHLLPTVQSIAVPCARIGCHRRDRVVQTCPDCGQTFCLSHRHASDHACPKIQELQLQAQAEIQRKKDIKTTIQNKFAAPESLASSATATAAAQTIENSLQDATRDKSEMARAKAEAAKMAIADAKAKVAARNAVSAAIPALPPGSSLSSPSSSALPLTDDTEPVKVAASATVAPKPKKASRIVSVMKLKKYAQGEDKIPLSSRVYVSIKSSSFPQLNDKAVYLDKTWTVGRSFDKIIEWLKMQVPKNEPFDAQKRFSIFHAKELEDTPTLLNMQDRLQQTGQVESGDIFYLAPADWDLRNK